MATPKRTALNDSVTKSVVISPIISPGCAGGETRDKSVKVPRGRKPRAKVRDAVTMRIISTYEHTARVP